jgi:hypothetical protein
MCGFLLFALSSLRPRITTERNPTARPSVQGSLTLAFKEER